MSERLEADPIGKLSLPPGFRFYPTDEELLVQYLCRKVAGHEFSIRIIGDTDLYKFDPWVLPSKAVFGEKEWYFFSPRDRKYPNGSRPNRVAGCGYWKATGTDKVICSHGRKVGIKKALVFYMGKAPLGAKTNWIMHEYRLFDSPRSNCASKLDDWVLCRIYKKNSAGSGGATAKDHTTGLSSASSYLDEVLETSPERVVSPQENNDPKVVLENYGSVSLDWSVLARLTADPEFGAIGPNQAQCHPQGDYVITNGGGTCLLEDEVKIGLGRSQRGDDVALGLFNPNPSMWAHSYSNSIDPFGGVRYPVAAFGSRQ